MKPLRLFSHRAARHTCGNPSVYHQLIYVPALDRFRCTGCGRFVWTSSDPRGHHGLRVLSRPRVR